MLRDIVWQEAGYFGFDEPDKLHHTATLVSQNVTVEHVRAGEVHKLVANPGPSTHGGIHCTDAERELLVVHTPGAVPRDIDRPSDYGQFSYAE